MIALNNIAAPPPSDQTVQALFELIGLLSDPAAATARITEYRQVAADLRSAADGLRKQQADFAPAKAAHQAALDDASAKHDAAIQDAQKAFDDRRLQIENALAAREQRLSELEKKAATDAEAAQALRADLNRRLELLRSATAA